MSWTATGGGDHEGADWTISSDMDVKGEHYNIGTLTIQSGTTATVPQLSCGVTGEYNYFRVFANSIEVAGTIYAVGAGFKGGCYNGELYSPQGNGAGGSGAGGGYGGAGQDEYGDTGSGGSVCGNVELHEYAGSGGGDDGGGDGGGGDGGGAVVLCAPSITVSGTINADAKDAYTEDVDGEHGGGAGGLVMLYGKDIDLTGATITADGSNGTYDSDVGTTGGHGGGGRLKMFYTGTYTKSSTTLSVAGGDNNPEPAAESGTITEEKLNVVKSGYSMGQEFRITNTGTVALNSVVVNVATVTSSGSFTVTVYDSASKNTTYGSETITISTTGTKTITFDPPLQFDEPTLVYMEIAADGGGEIELAVNQNYDGYYAYRNGYEAKYVGLYYQVEAFLQVKNPLIYNLQDADTKAQFAGKLLAGAYHEVNPKGTGIYHYEDDFSTGKYGLDRYEINNVTRDSGANKLMIDSNGYIVYYFDTVYPIRKTPILSAKINDTGGSAKIQISSDGSTWYDIETTVENGVELDYKLINETNLSLRRLTNFYIRIKNKCEIESMSIDVYYVTQDILFPVIEKDAENTFKFEQDVDDSYADVLLQYADKRLI